jgi:hypothetical protein
MTIDTAGPSLRTRIAQPFMPPPRSHATTGGLRRRPKGSTPGGNRRVRHGPPMSRCGPLPGAGRSTASSSARSSVQGRSAGPGRGSPGSWPDPRPRRDPSGRWGTCETGGGSSTGPDPGQGERALGHVARFVYPPIPWGCQSIRCLTRPPTGLRWGNGDPTYRALNFP